MTRIALLMAIILSASPAMGEVDEATKIAALKLAYELNGQSMVRWGSIDLSKPVGDTLSKSDRLIPMTPVEKEKKRK